MKVYSSRRPVFRAGILFFLLAVGRAAADTPVSGTISTSTTWTTSGSPYVLTGSVFVQGAGTPVLTIQPGVTVKFNGGAELIISYTSPGALHAVGTSGSRILFTANGSTTPGFWNGIYIGYTTPASLSQISYATVEYGGWTTWTRGGIHVQGLSPTLSNLTVRNSVVAGITVNGGSPSMSTVTLTGNSGPGLLVSAGSPTMSGSSTVSSNTSYGLNVTGGSLNVSSTSITNNGNYAISAIASSPLTTLTGLTVSGNGPGKDLIERTAGTISSSQTWPVAVVPYVLTGDVYVQGTGTPVLTIQPGVTVKFNFGAQLIISYTSPGALQAVGTFGSRILFTANGSTTPGFWNGLYIGYTTPASSSQISYATVEYGGYTPYARGGIHIQGLSPTFSNLTVRKSVVAGITVNGGSPSMSTATLTDNGGPGLLVSDGSPTMSGSTITSNTDYGLNVTGGSLNVSSTSITNNGNYAISAAAPAVLSGLTGLTASGNGPGKDLIERRMGAISTSQTWVPGSLPYVVTGDLYVEGTGTPILTIQAGVTVKFNSGAELLISYNNPGALVAVGTAASPILFTANGSTASGFWKGLYIGNKTPATTTQISYATVEYGGWTAYTRGGIHVWSIAPTLDHLTLRNNVIAGVSVDLGSPTVTNCTFVGNDAGLIATAATNPVNARLNWWNATSGPSGSGPGSGQSVSTRVFFDPWLTAPVSSPEYISSATYNNRKFNPSGGTPPNWNLGSSQSASWTLAVSNSQSVVVRTLTASGLTAALSWDGKNDTGVLQPDGTYTYTIQAVSGSAATPAAGRAFLDSTLLVNITAPGASQTFSNVYQNGSTDVLVAGTARMSGLTGWTLEYGLGASPSSWISINTGTSAVVASTLGTWATVAIAGGLYSLRLRASDNQSNDFSFSQTDTFAGNFSVTQQALIEMNASVGDTVTYTSTVPFTLTETVVVKNLAGQVVRTLVNAASRPTNSYVDTWNGRNDAGGLVPDGPYFYVATVTAGASNMTWDLTNQAGAPVWRAFNINPSPAWDPFNNQPLSVTYSFNTSSTGRAVLRFRSGSDSTPIPDCNPPRYCLLNNQYLESGIHTFTWTGIDDAGVFHGDFDILDVFQQPVNPLNLIVVFGTKPSVTSVHVTPAFYGPLSGTQAVSFNLSTYQNQAVNISVALKNLSSNSVLRTVTASGQTPGAVTVNWDGHADTGLWVAPGFYAVTVTATDSIGNSVSSQILTTVLY